MGVQTRKSTAGRSPPLWAGLACAAGGDPVGYCVCNGVLGRRPWASERIGTPGRRVLGEAEGVFMLENFGLATQSSSTAGKGKSSQSSIKVTYGYSLVKGRTNHPIEDYHVSKFMRMKGKELGLFAIFDGHLGDSVPAYLQKHLFANILKEQEFWSHPDRAISKAYDKTDKAILSHSSDLGRGGSTAVTAILINGQKLWIANVGDSRGVLAKGGQVMQMTVDHEPSAERGSIENRGGFVSNMPGDVPRVNGQLAVSRAFGDKSLKSHLCSDPDIRVEDITPDTELLILASDGIWKFVSNEEAVEIARKIKDPQAAAKRLTAEALERESKDDISCIVVRFKP
ncbi:hypothetical protein Taro_014385 [Colocasia esculenta]|uniref:protein-serine/threonine phosphatase n=1 Tax=Colocasia esculenta TaxID=4460 RepID=A0A843UPZ6_COLES|nr:hypothetical protein [Colocasia esculenta]